MTGVSRDRPPGIAPKGTSWGIGLMSVYAPGVPALTAMAVSPWLPGGADTGLAVALAAVGVWAVIAIPLIIGFKLRRYWGIVLYFYVGVFCVVALPAVIVILAGLILATAHHRPTEFYDVWFGLGLVAMVPFWPRLIRALRLKYWQPWTRPDEWEAGGERIAGWVFDAAGVPCRPTTGQGAMHSSKTSAPKDTRVQRRG